MEFNHISVLLKECIESLNIKEDGIYVDGTIGGGGHSLEIVKKLTTGKLIGIDQDSDALIAAGKTLEEYKDKVIFVKNNYKNIKEILLELNIDKVDGILLDIGVSSYQLDNEERGFSYNTDARLDMRMNVDDEFSAWDVVNNYTVEELSGIFWKYGEESWGKRVAEFIVEERKNKTIDTSFELVKIIKAAIPKMKRMEKHPAKKIFQAIRIEVNNELEVLKKIIDDGVDVLNSKGRLSIITFHSLEDRIVKQKFKKLENPCVCPPKFPVCMCGNVSSIKIITKKPILPSESEINTNRRSKSAKLRCLEKI